MFVNETITNSEVQQANLSMALAEFIAGHMNKIVDSFAKDNKEAIEAANLELDVATVSTSLMIVIGFLNANETDREIIERVFHYVLEQTRKAGNLATSNVVDGNETIN